MPRTPRGCNIREAVQEFVHVDLFQMVSSMALRVDRSSAHWVGGWLGRTELGQLRDAFETHACIVHRLLS